MATWLSTSVFPLKVVFFVSSDFSLASFEIVLFLISRCDKYSFIHATSVEKLNFLSSTKWKQGRLKELAKLTAGYMISSGRRPLSYISMHENAFKKAVAKKNRVYVGNYLPQHPSQISYHDGSRLCGANLKP